MAADFDAVRGLGGGAARDQVVVAGEIDGQGRLGPKQLTSWAFTERAETSGLVPSTEATGDCFDNAMVESFWGRMQTELLNRCRWRTRIELANAIFEYLEILHNRRRRHSALGRLTPSSTSSSAALPDMIDPVVRPSRVQHPDPANAGAHSPNGCRSRPSRLTWI